MGMMALTEVQPVPLQSFVSTSLSMVTSRGWHLKMMIHMQVFLSAEGVRLLPLLPPLCLGVTCFDGIQCHTAHANCIQPLLVTRRSPAEFLNSMLSVRLSTGLKKKKASFNLEAEPAQCGISSH